MNSVYSQSQVDTIYCDAEGYGVEHPSFADYYRVTLTSSNPNKPNRYKDYLMDGTLISEGNFIKIDKDVESQSIFSCSAALNGLIRSGEKRGLPIYSSKREPHHKC